jgi:hypothetical protein
VGFEKAGMHQVELNKSIDARNPFPVGALILPMIMEIAKGQSAIRASYID